MSPVEKAGQGLKSFPYWRDVIVATVTAVGVLGGNMLMAGPQQTTADAEYIRSLGPRITELEAEVRTLVAENTKLKIAQAVREAQGGRDFAFQDMLCSILEAQPGLNWAKLVEVDAEQRVTFRMACLDAEYRSRFKIGPFEYVGETDFDVWPEGTARQFYENDLAVFSTRRPLVSQEQWVEPDGAVASGYMTKFYYRYDGPADAPGLEFVIGHLPRSSGEIGDRGD